MMESSNFHSFENDHPDVNNSGQERERERNEPRTEWSRSLRTKQKEWYGIASRKSSTSQVWEDILSSVKQVKGREREVGSGLGRWLRSRDPRGNTSQSSTFLLPLFPLPFLSFSQNVLEVSSCLSHKWLFTFSVPSNRVNCSIIEWPRRRRRRRGRKEEEDNSLGVEMWS